MMSVGNLFKRGILATKIFPAISQELLGRRTDFSIECLCTLLKCVGPSFEESLSAGVQRVENIRGQLDDIYSACQEMSKTGSKNTGDGKAGLKPRTRFMLLDMLELREKGWKSER